MCGLPMVNLEVVACYFFSNMCGCMWGCGWATNIHGSKWSSMCMCIISDRQRVETFLSLGCNVWCMERIPSVRNTRLLTLLQWLTVHSPFHGAVWWFYSFLQRQTKARRLPWMKSKENQRVLISMGARAIGDAAVKIPLSDRLLVRVLNRICDARLSSWWGIRLCAPSMEESGSPLFREFVAAGP